LVKYETHHLRRFKVTFSQRFSSGIKELKKLRAHVSIAIRDGKPLWLAFDAETFCVTQTIQSFEKSEKGVWVTPWFSCLAPRNRCLRLTTLFQENPKTLHHHTLELRSGTAWHT